MFPRQEAMFLVQKSRQKDVKVHYLGLAWSQDPSKAQGVSWSLTAVYACVISKGSDATTLHLLAFILG